MELTKKKKTIIFLVLLLILAFTLRVWNIKNDLLFHRDQGVHSLDIYKIWHDHKFSLLGPTTDVDGIVHSPVYYWLMAPAYAVGRGDPGVASLFQILLEVVSLPLLYFALVYFFNKRTAILSLILYTVSYGMISQSRWLSNVTPIIPFSNLLVFLIAYQLKKRIKPLLIFLSSLVVGVMTQHDAAVAIFLFPFLLWFYRKNLKSLSNLSLIMAGFLLPATPLIIFEFRHNFVLTNAILRFFGSSGRGLGFTFGVFWTNLVTFLRQVSVATFYPIILVSSLLFILGLIRLYGKKQALTIYAFLLIPFIFLGLFQRGAIGFFFDALLPLAVGCVIYGLEYFSKPVGNILLGFIILTNLWQLPYIYQPTNALTPIGDGNVITLQDRKNIIDWMYVNANGKAFSVWFYTIPYYQEESWTYLFTIYAKPKYGYLPEATHGFSPKDLKVSQLFFAVYEPEYDNARMGNQISWLTDVKSVFGGVRDSYRSDDVVVRLTSWQPK